MLRFMKELTMEESIQLYRWPGPNSWKVSIMLEECALPYDLPMLDIGRGEQLDPSFLAI